MDTCMHNATQPAVAALDAARADLEALRAANAPEASIRAAEELVAALVLNYAQAAGDAATSCLETSDDTD
jgi:hypothetical protein